MKREVERILSVLNKIESQTITVFGDYCLDKYLYIDPLRDEISLETSLTAYQADRQSVYPGVGGTVTNNLRALGAGVKCIGLVGDDGEGYDLLKGLELEGADIELMVRSDAIMTNTYIKPMRKVDEKTYSEMNRMDIRNFSSISMELEDSLLVNLEKALTCTSGVVVTDQFLESNCAAVTDRTRNKLAELAGLYPDKFFYADSRGHAGSYRDVIVKCNQFELPGAGGNEEDIDESVIMKRGKELLKSNNKAVVVTVGEKGAYVFEHGEPIHIPAINVDGPLDIVGAGDATNAGVILGLVLGLTLPEAVLLGGCISSITIKQIGVTGTATVDQIEHQLLEHCIS